MNVYEMKLHDEITESPWYITRVPGGWVYMHNEAGTSPIFVPFNNDFQETPKIKEAQNSIDNNAMVPCNGHKVGVMCRLANRRICGETPCFFDYRPAQHQ